jgi:two-component system sensor histidine kinase HydH
MADESRRSDPQSDRGQRACRSKVLPMQKLAKTTKVRVILVCVAAVTLLFYVTPIRQYLLQELVTRIFYVPIVLGGLWFGLQGGGGVSLLITVICIPHAFLAFGYDKALFYDEVLELFLFNLVGPVVGALRDRERRQQALNQKLHALATLGETVASVAHEMKNMLIPIRGFLRKIREKQDPGAKAASYLEIVDQESAKLEKMVKDMLAFGRFAPLQKEEVEVQTLVEDMQQMMTEEFHDNGVRLVCGCQEGIRKVSLDREKVRQALANLLQNALQASPKGKGVRLLVRLDQGILHMVVEDEGAGIPKEHLDRLFQPFFTTKPQGTGLGLAITHQIVKDHGGDIKVESIPGTGTSVFLSFPDL